MKTKRKIVIIFLIVIAISLFFPPKKDYVYNSADSFVDGVYYDYSNDSWHYGSIFYGVGHINYTMLIIQDIIIFMIFSVVFMIVGNRKK